MSLAPLATAEVAPIVKPGAPGESSQALSAEEAVRIADTSYSPADARFMQGMIPHHHQAMQMARLVADRTNHPELIDIAGRINASQDDPAPSDAFSSAICSAVAMPLMFRPGHDQNELVDSPHLCSTSMPIGFFVV